MASSEGRPTVDAGSPTVRRTVPPSAAPGTLRRPRLESRLGEGALRRLTTVVAGAGYGKSTLLASWAAGRDDVAWYALGPGDRHLPTFLAGVMAALGRVVGDLPPELASVAGRVGADASTDEGERVGALAGFVCAALDEPLAGRSVVLVLDDLHEVDDVPTLVRFVEGLVRGAPDGLHVVLASRLSIPFGVHRLRGQGQVVDIAAEALAMTVDEVGALLGPLSEAANGSSSGLAAEIAAATAGWPVAVRLVIDALREAPLDRRAHVLERLHRPDGPLFGYIAEEVLGREPAEVVRVLRVAATFDRVDEAFLAAVGVPDAGPLLVDLAERASFVQRVGGEREFTLHTLVAEFIRAAHPLEPEEARRIQVLAAARFEADGRIEAALDAWFASGDMEGLRSFVERSIDGLRSATAMGRLGRLADVIPRGQRSAAVEILLGDAAMLVGDQAAALAAYARAGADEPTVDPGLAYRVAVLHHERGDIPATLELLDRCDPAAGVAADVALCSALRAIASWTTMDPSVAGPHARRALELARVSGDDRALAAACEAAAIVANMEGDAPAAERLFRLGVEHAERGGDPLLHVRTRNDYAYHLLDEGRYAEARDELERAVRLAATLGQSTFHALALVDLGQALVGLGRLEDALADVRLARAIYERHDSAWVAYALAREGTIHRLRGDLPAAVGVFRQALAAALSLGHGHVSNDARTGLAEALAGDDPDEARRLVDEALASGMVYVPNSVRLNIARVRLAVGEPDAAAGDARSIVAAARARRDRASLASALELLALAEPGEATRQGIDEAAAIWRAIKAPLGIAGNLVVRARTIGGPEGRAAALEAEQRYRDLGAKGAADDAAALAARLERASVAQVVVQALGRFRVLRDGVPVTPSEWQSRKARDLLKFLVARRGRPSTREALAEALWPDEDPLPLANRLSVALTTVRLALDPEKRHGPEWYVVADKTSVALDLDHVRVDLEAFHADARRGIRLAGSPGADDEALVHLLAADAAYAGDFLEEDLDAAWAAVLREEARDLAVSVSRALAELAVRRGDGAAAARHLLQVLERDPYDEPAHLGLVAVLSGDGRHGEARRRYGMYVQRMDEIGVEAAPFPGGGRAAGREPAGVLPGFAAAGS